LVVCADKLEDSMKRIPDLPIKIKAVSARMLNANTHREPQHVAMKQVH
jgi:hypothetical protein